MIVYTTLIYSATFLQQIPIKCIHVTGIVLDNEDTAVSKTDHIFSCRANILVKRKKEKQVSI